VTTYAAQVDNLARLARERAHLGSPSQQLALTRALFDLEAAMAGAGLPFDESVSDRCRDWATGRSTWDRWRFGSAECQAWVIGVQDALDLVAGIVASFDPALAEAFEAAADQAEANAGRRGNIIGNPDDWWGSLPRPAKIAAAAVAAWLAIDVWAKIK